MSAAGRCDEAYRRACEARTWLRMGYDSPARVDDLMTRIAKHRGAAAADELREEMRRQWLLQQGTAS